MTKALLLRTAGVFSVLALTLMLLGSAVILASSGTAAQDALETFKECRRARDTFWDSMSQNDCARRQPFCAPVRPASVALRRHLARSMPAAHHSLK